MKIVVFTDLDATLLDSDTYSWTPAQQALQALKERKAAVILVSSKTLAEMQPIHDELELADPFVVENGGGIFFPSESSLSPHVLSKSRYPMRRYGNFSMLSLGVGYECLVQSLAEISERVGFHLMGFSSMTDSEVAELTGLDLKEAARARTRLFDEPFVIEGPCADKAHAVKRVAAEKGLTVVEGGRFLHLIGHAGKGAAVAMLMDAYRNRYDNVFTVGLGDSPNDFPFLELVDHAILVGSAGKPLDLPESIENAHQTQSSGPHGWNQAVIEMLEALQDKCQQQLNWSEPHRPGAG